jgi:uncharacterized protein (TIGR02271 family)
MVDQRKPLFMDRTNEYPPLSIPVMEEQVQVDKKVVESAKVRIVKRVHEDLQDVDLSTRSEEVEIHKVVINKYVDAAPAIRYEGDTMIVPVMKEVVVAEKKLVLAEEIHITKKTMRSNDQQTIPLLREELHVERVTKNEIQ